MSKIDDLIKQYCPNGVEYKELGNIVNILDNQRRPVAKEKRKRGNIPYYGANGIQDWVNDYIFDGTFLLVGEDGSVINKDNTPVLNWANRYDVSILVNGLPLVHIELKKRGVAIREAFNQVHRYSKESFNSENSLYKYLQIFVISNGTDTRYFANTTKRNKNSFDFTINWAKSDNSPIKDLKDFTATFLQKNTLLKIITKYSVFDSNNTLLIMRPYQIAATERILWKINCSYQSKIWNK